MTGSVFTGVSDYFRASVISIEPQLTGSVFTGVSDYFWASVISTCIGPQLTGSVFTGVSDYFRASVISIGPQLTGSVFTGVSGLFSGQCDTVYLQNLSSAVLNKAPLSVILLLWLIPILFCWWRWWW